MQSPLKLFRSLKQGDPQSIAFTAVFVFLMSVCWFSWTFLFPQKDKSLPLGGGRIGKPVPIETVSLSEVLEVHRVFLTPGDIPNPFYREPPEERKPRNSDNKTQENQQDNPRPNAPPQNTNGTALIPRPPPPPEAKPTTRPLTLTYRGLLTRPDETTVALISISEQNTQKFIGVGDRIPPFTINEISPEGIQIQQEKGPAIFLPRGSSQKFEVPL